jgi:hypothetical protein
VVKAAEKKSKIKFVRPNAVLYLANLILWLLDIMNLVRYRQGRARNIRVGFLGPLLGLAATGRIGSQRFLARKWDTVLSTLLEDSKVGPAILNLVDFSNPHLSLQACPALPSKLVSDPEMPLQCSRALPSSQFQIAFQSLQPLLDRKLPLARIVLQAYVR